jgi:hypothetical protein
MKSSIFWDVVPCSPVKVSEVHFLRITRRYIPEGKNSVYDRYIYIYIYVENMVLGPIQRPIQWVPWVLSPGVKRPVREANLSPPTNVEVKEM